MWPAKFYTFLPFVGICNWCNSCLIYSLSCFRHSLVSLHPSWYHLSLLVHGCKASEALSCSPLALHAYSDLLPASATDPQQQARGQTQALHSVFCTKGGSAGQIRLFSLLDLGALPACIEATNFCWKYTLHSSLLLNSQQGWNMPVCPGWYPLMLKSWSGQTRTHVWPSCLLPFCSLTNTSPEQK